MTLDEALVQRMRGFGSLASLVSDRIHPGKLPENSAYPAVTYVQVSGTPETAMGADPGLGPRVYQFSAWDPSFATMRAVLAQLKVCWERYAGTISGVVLQDAYIVNEATIWDPDGPLWHGALDVQLWAEG